MSSNLIFTSANREKGWVFEILANNFPKEHIVEIDFDTPFCVFKVPKTLTETKPEAYTPQKMGLGPYHHLRPDLYPMQKQKLAVVRKFFNQDNLNNVHKVVEALIQCEPVLRACYDRYLDLDAKTLAWIVAVDGLYLLQFFKKYPRKEKTTAESSDEAGNSGKSSDKVNESDDPEIERDIVMLENQIPAVLLKKILHVHENNIHTLFKDFDGFCGEYSPLKLSENSEIVQDENQHHLLHRMYHLIVGEVPPSRTGTDDNHDNHPCLVQAFRKIGSFAQQIPCDKITSAFTNMLDWLKNLQGFTGDTVPLLEDNDQQNQSGEESNTPSDTQKKYPLVGEINIPSVTQMSEIAGIMFNHLPDHVGIRNIRFDKCQRKFHLPVISIGVHTETVLRNLVAFELSKPGSTHDFALYVDLMCGIIDTKEDVEILKNANIIEGELPKDEIVRIFNGIRRSTKENYKEKSNIKLAIDDVNKMYDDMGSVKFKRFLKKYFCDSGKCTTACLSVVVAVSLTLHTFWLVLRLSRWFGGRSAL